MRIGRDRSSSDFDEAAFREDYYTVPFRMGFEEGGARCFMASYNAWNQVPCTVQPVINDVAVREWGVDGIICTDGGAAANLVREQHYYANATRPPPACVKAGINQFLDNTSPTVRRRAGKQLLTEADIDQDIKGNLRVFIRLGLLDPPANNPYAGIGAGGRTGAVDDRKTQGPRAMGHAEIHRAFEKLGKSVAAGQDRN